MNGAQALVKSLASEGIEVIFGLPGTQIMAIYDALYHEPGIKVVTTRHEQGTTYMADGYARTTGKIAAALVVPGPGTLNALSGLGTAFACSSPILLISGQVPSKFVGSKKGMLHEVDDQLDAIRPLTKWSARIMNPQKIPDAIHEAARQLKTGRPRPVEVEIPQDILYAKAEIKISKPKPVKASKPSLVAIRKAARMLSLAKRPIILAGSGVMISDASQELRTLAEKINAPVITTPEGKGSIREDHPLSLGASYIRHGCAKFAVPLADVILAVGTRLLVQSLAFSIQPNQKVIQVDIDPEEIGRNVPLALGITSDAKLALHAITSGLPSKKRNSEWRQDELESFRKQTLEILERDAKVQLEICKVLREALKDDAIVVNGVTNMGHWSPVCLKALEPRTYITPGYFGTLGFAYPTAVGAKIGNPDKQVVALCGDGGFMFTSQELCTAVKHKANVVTLLFEDKAFGSSLSEQRVGFEGRIFETQLLNPDFVRYAESFGAVGIQTNGPGDLKDALDNALKQEMPVVVDIPMPTLPPPFHTKG